MKAILGRILRSTYSPIILGGILIVLPAIIPGRGLYWGTASLQFISWRILAFDQIRDGIVPLWNSMNGMGAPLMANYQLALFYPPSWLTFIFGWIAGREGIIWALGFLLSGHIIWAGIGMVKLMKRLGVNEVGQIIAGLAFALSGYWVARGSFFSMVWAGSWIPWVILAASEIANPVDCNIIWKRFLPTTFIFCLAMQLLAGHAQLTWYTIILSSSWVFVGIIVRKKLKKGLVSLSQFVIGGVVAGMISAIQIIPTAEYLLNSQRADAYAYEQAMTFSFWPWRILTLLMPNLFGSPGTGNYWGYAAYWEDAIYIGLIPLVLAVCTLLLKRRKLDDVTIAPYRSLIPYLWILILVGFCLALGKNTSIFPWLYRNVPTFDMFQAPTRFMVLCVFALSVLAGISSDRWKKPTGRNARKVSRAMVGTVAILIGAIAAKILFPNIKPSFILSMLFTGGFGLIMGALTLYAPRRETLAGLGWRWMVAGIITLDLILANWGLNPTSEVKFYSEQNNVLVENIRSSRSRLYISSDDEYLLKFRRFFRFSDFRSIEGFDYLLNSMLPNLNIIAGLPSANNFDPLSPERFSIFIQWLESLPENQRITLMERVNIGWIEKRVTDTREGVEFQALDALPKVQWRACAEWVLKSGEVLPEMKNNLERDNGEGSVVVEGIQPNTQENCLRSKANLSFVETSNRVRIQVQTENAGWLFLANAWYPGWNVYVDEKKEINNRADFLFQAVQVGVGTHMVEWRYEPKSWLVGVCLSGFSLLIMVVWSCWSAFRNRYCRRLDK
jgi:uncharacterized membrane protein YfhO